MDGRHCLRRIVKPVLVGTVVVCALFGSRPAEGVSVLAHEANVDAEWDATIKPMLLARFPGTSREQLQEARGYGYGGCVERASPRPTAFG